MNESRTELLAGFVVIAFAVAAVIYAFGVTSSGAGERGSYTLSASFRSVDGISAGTDIRLAGVSVGRVSDLTLNSETFRAEASLAINNGIEIPTDSAVIISTEGLLGGNYVEIVPGGELEVFADGDEFNDTQGSISLISLLLKFVSGGDSE